jgi:Zn-dependent protease with chaperone function
MTNRRRYTIRCVLYIKHDTHKLLTVFTVFPCLISLLLAPCDGTTVLYTTEDTLILVLYKMYLLLVIDRYWVLVSRFSRFISGTH